MAVKKILRMGDARLLRRAEEVTDFESAGLQEWLGDMRDTMQALDGVGLAAPQIGINLRIVIFGAESNPRYPDADEVPETVLVNPIITPLSQTKENGWEGCLSLPGMRGQVPRFTHLRYQGRDQYGALIDRTVSGFHARVVQHECDHLDGVLYPMRIEDMRNFGFNSELFPDEKLQDE